MTDFRALCAELVDALQYHREQTRPIKRTTEILTRARAALAQPEPQGPTGCPAIEPVPVAERLPRPEDCDAEGRCWFYKNEMWMKHAPKYALPDASWLPRHGLPVPQS